MRVFFNGCVVRDMSVGGQSRGSEQSLTGVAAFPQYRRQEQRQSYYHAASEDAASTLSIMTGEVHRRKIWKQDQGAPSVGAPAMIFLLFVLLPLMPVLDAGRQQLPPTVSTTRFVHREQYQHHPLAVLRTGSQGDDGGSDEAAFPSNLEVFAEDPNWACKVRSRLLQQRLVETTTAVPGAIATSKLQCGHSCCGCGLNRRQFLYRKMLFACGMSSSTPLAPVLNYAQLAPGAVHHICRNVRYTKCAHHPVQEYSLVHINETTQYRICEIRAKILVSMYLTV